MIVNAFQSLIIVSIVNNARKRLILLVAAIVNIINSLSLINSPPPLGGTLLTMLDQNSKRTQTPRATTVPLWLTENQMPGLGR